MKKSDAFPSPFLAKEDCRVPLQLTIASIEKEPVNDEGEKKDKVVVKFKNHEKGMILNAGNWAICEMLFGDESDNWIGRQVEAYVDPAVQFKGKIVGGVRLRAPNNAAAQPGTGTMTFLEAVSKVQSLSLDKTAFMADLKAAIAPRKSWDGLVDGPWAEKWIEKSLMPFEAPMPESPADQGGLVEDDSEIPFESARTL